MTKKKNGTTATAPTASKGKSTKEVMGERGPGEHPTFADLIELGIVKAPKQD